MKKNYVKYLLMILVLVMTACGSKDGSKSDDIELVVGTWTGRPDITQMQRRQFAAFEKENPGITIDHRVYVNNYDQGIQTEYAAGVAPDVFFMDIASAANYIDKKVVMPLDDYLTDEVSNYSEAAINGFIGEDGKVYGLPKDSATLVLFYNKDYFKVAGIEKAPETWQELIEASKKLLAAKDAGKLPKEFIHPLSMILDGVRVAPFIYSNGGKMVDSNGDLDLNDPKTKEAMEFYYSLIREGYADIPQNQGTATIESSFAEGKSAMIMSGTWGETFFRTAATDLNYDKSILPYSKKPSTMFLSVAYAVNSKTKHEEAAAKFVKFISGIKGQTILIESEHALPTVTALREDFLDKYPHKKAFMDSIEFATPWNWGTETQRISKEMKTYGEKAVMDDEMDIDEVVELISNRF